MKVKVISLNDPRITTTVSEGMNIVRFNVAVPINNGTGGGTTWYNGNGVPSVGLGLSGDFYLDNLTGDYYKKI
jgi:hypothetical protein